MKEITERQKELIEKLNKCIGDNSTMSVIITITKDRNDDIDFRVNPCDIKFTNYDDTVKCNKNISLTNVCIVKYEADSKSDLIDSEIKVYDIDSVFFNTKDLLNTIFVDNVDEYSFKTCEAPNYYEYGYVVLDSTDLCDYFYNGGPVLGLKNRNILKLSDMYKTKNEFQKYIEKYEKDIENYKAEIKKINSDIESIKNSFK